MIRRSKVTAACIALASAMRELKRIGAKKHHAAALRVADGVD